MANTHLISIRQIASSYGVETTLLHSLHDYGLVQIEHSNDDDFLEEESLPQIESYLRMHQELGINLEGIDAIRCMLERVGKMQQELIALRRRLARYEEP